MKRPLKTIAGEIDAFLKRFESDPKINKQSAHGARFYNAGSWYWGGPKLVVQYVSYQGQSYLSREEGERYLAWLKEGRVGRHYEALRDEPKR